MQISVVIPTYNRSELVCRAIDSVLHQTRPANEIIVIDDGSTDNTVSVLKSRYGNQINLIVTQSNSGVSAARNIGISSSEGDWIALLDSDDSWLESKLETQEAALNNRAELLCHTDEIWIRNGVRVNPMRKHGKFGGEIFDHCLPLCVISPSSALIHKELLESVGGFDESLPACEDYDLWLKICSQHKVLFLPSPQLVKYGGHADQLSRKYWGMDRFRTQSLRNLLNSNTLTNHQRTAVLECLLQKTEILLKGARKRNNELLINYCETIKTSHYPHTDSKDHGSSIC